MTRVLIDPDGLERTARVLDHLADEYHGLAQELYAFPNLPGPIGSWVDAERGRVSGGFDAQAGTLHSIAGRLRARAQEARSANAGASRHERRISDGLPRWPPAQPRFLPSFQAENRQDAFIRWLSAHAFPVVGAGTGGLQLYRPALTASTRSGSDLGLGPVLAMLILVAGAIGVVGTIAGSHGTNSAGGDDSANRSKAAGVAEGVAGHPAPSPPGRLTPRPESR
jgi:hypothetical protein